jgi:hypothetical protein
MRSFLIGFFSIALSGVVITNAFYQKKQFYPSVLYITKSNPSMAVSIFVQEKLPPMTFHNFLFYVHKKVDKESEKMSVSYDFLKYSITLIVNSCYSSRLYIFNL